MRADFAVFVLTHGRSDRVFTIKALREFKYTGPIYLVVDDEDAQLPAYREAYGENVLVFSKAEIAAEYDEADNFEDRRSVFYARNACWSLARKVGVKYFMHCDDDYTGFYIRQNAEGVYGSYRAECLDQIIDAMISFFASVPAKSIAMSQGGDHIGGLLANPQPRKAMNTFICDVDRPFRFVGRINEDVNTYTLGGRRGELFLTIPTVQVNQKQTQTNPGGMTDLYKDSGTYVKSFYSVMFVPSSVSVGELRRSEARIHHRIYWPATAVQIVPETYRKEA